MKKFLSILIIFMLLLIPYKAYTETLEEENIIAAEMIESELEETEQDLNGSGLVEYDFQVNLNNLRLYNIVALNNAELKQPIHGSIWVGGTFSGNQPVEGADNYVYNNVSTITNCKILNYNSIEISRNFWTQLMEDLVYGDESFIYLEPDENNQVSLAQNNDKIERVFYTNASTVYINNFSGHLIAPFADVYIGTGEFYGAVVGWNVYSEGEGHPIDYTFTRPEPHEKGPNPGTIKLKKTLINDVWHIRCDVMDGTTFQAGGGIWKTDIIMNPNKITSKEGHRSNKCGDADHWIIWLNTDGIPFRMDEIKSGATGGTLPTMIFEEIYSPQDLGFNNWGELEPEDTEKVELYKENFMHEKDIKTVKPGERIYWVTWDKNRVWYHSGVPYIAPPTFTFYIDGEPYPIVAGQTLELTDVLPGAHEIREDVSVNDYIITVYGGNDTNGTTTTVNIIDGETIEVEYQNETITPPEIKPPTPPKPRPNPPSDKPEPPHIIPQTGDYNYIPLMILFILAISFIIIIISRKKRNL